MVPLPQGKVVMVHEVGGAALIAASAAAWDWSEDNDIAIETSEVRRLIFDDERNEHALLVGVAWTVDVGHATDDEWVWSARWEHWRAWFESMRLAAFARGFEQPTTQVVEFFEPRGGYVTGRSQDSDSVPVLFRDADARIVSALQDPNWGGEAVVVGAGQAVRIPINVDEPVKARTLADTFADPNLAFKSHVDWTEDEQAQAAAWLANEQAKDWWRRVTTGYDPGGVR